MPTNSVHQNCLELIAETIKGLALDRLAPEEVVVCRKPWKDEGNGNVVIDRGIRIHKAPEAEAAGTNERDDIGYGCFVTMIVPTDESQAENTDLVGAWRATIRREFLHARLDVSLDDGQYVTTKVSHGEIDVPKEAHRYEVSTLLIRCWMREPRS